MPEHTQAGGAASASDEDDGDCCIHADGKPVTHWAHKPITAGRLRPDTIGVCAEHAQQRKELGDVVTAVEAAQEPLIVLACAGDVYLFGPDQAGAAATQQMVLDVAHPGLDVMRFLVRPDKLAAAIEEVLGEGLPVNVIDCRSNRYTTSATNEEGGAMSNPTYPQDGR